MCKDLLGYLIDSNNIQTIDIGITGMNTCNTNHNERANEFEIYEELGLLYEIPTKNNSKNQSITTSNGFELVFEDDDNNEDLVVVTDAVNIVDNEAVSDGDNNDTAN